MFSNLSLGTDYLFVEGGFNSNANWTQATKDEQMNVKILLQKLAQSKTGKELIIKANRKALTYGETLYDVIKKGHGSLTDTTLIRKFSASNPEHVVFEVRSKVYLNKSLSQYDALLDLAHELTHFIYRRDFNPYELNFSLTDFIKDTIEGHGGEAEAFLSECQVQKELFAKSKGFRGNCKKAMNDSKVVSRENVVASFYRVGDFYDSFSKTLTKYGIKDNFPRVSADEVGFVSSAYGIPYPVAAFEEYINVLGKVCENDKKRMSYFKRDTSGRFPASTISEFENSYHKRCAILSL